MLISSRMEKKLISVLLTFGELKKDHAGKSWNRVSMNWPDWKGLKGLRIRLPFGLSAVSIFFSKRYVPFWIYVVW